MKEKPFAFSTPEVKAILEGRKTMTQRVIKPLKDGKVPSGVDTKCLWELHREDGKFEVLGIAPVKMGDILWVRETWQENTIHSKENRREKPYLYKADPDGVLLRSWRPSICLPRKAARIFLEVKSVRVERLRDISEREAYREGITTAYFVMPDEKTKLKLKSGGTFITAFKYAWNDLNAKRGYSWDSNPWVWVIEFERVEYGKQKL